MELSDDTDAELPDDTDAELSDDTDIELPDDPDVELAVWLGVEVAEDVVGTVDSEPSEVDPRIPPESSPALHPARASSPPLSHALVFTKRSPGTHSKL